MGGGQQGQSVGSTLAAEAQGEASTDSTGEEWDELARWLDEEHDAFGPIWDSQLWEDPS